MTSTATGGDRVQAMCLCSQGPEQEKVPGHGSESR